MPWKQKPDGLEFSGNLGLAVREISKQIYVWKRYYDMDITFEEVALRVTLSTGLQMRDKFSRSLLHKGVAAKIQEYISLMENNSTANMMVCLDLLDYLSNHFTPNERDMYFKKCFQDVDDLYLEQDPETGKKKRKLT